MIWLTVITGLLIFIGWTLISYIYYKLHTFLTTKECFIKSSKSGLAIASGVTFLVWLRFIDYAEWWNYIAVHGGC